ncbi:MAG: 2-succinyl-6-hydroxy-2,4-cyclohexadiene-1-carboxylate synthase [Opitutales bacterium]|nr:2-succinyl-6-hydroxy-2,4-cyclohexadiene-1-carboxylate synthase [Opitutales bacterium]
MNHVVALHGFTGQGADFEPLRPFLPPGTSLAAPDLPGHGSKSLLKDLSAYALPAHLAAISEAATDPQITLLGYSMGGRLALHWAIAHPERVRRLILVGASPGLATPEERAERRLGDATLAEFIRTRGLEAFFKYWHNQTFFQPMLRLPKEQLDPILARRSQNNPEGLALSLENVGTGTLPSLWHRLKELRVPVDLVTGEHDVKFARLAREMGAHLPKARHSLIEGAGHAVHLEKPADLAMLLK